MAYQGLIARYGDRMRVARNVAPVTLLEGNTPLIKAERLADDIAPGCELYFKYEGLNPTGSFKDRGMTAAMTQAVADGADIVVCASTGNTAASAAAYAARAGLECQVLIPAGKIAIGKLAAAIAYGAKVIEIEGSFDDALRMVQQMTRDDASSKNPKSEDSPQYSKLITRGASANLKSKIQNRTSQVVLVNSLNPARLEGQKTAAWEIQEQLGQTPDWLCLPVGNAGNITAYWLGFMEAGGPKPRLLGAQAEGAAPIVLGRKVENPETVATAIRIGNPARWNQAVQALQESNGLILSVSDAEILDCYGLLARMEGIFCEPSSAAGVAGLRKAVREGRVNVEGMKVVCVLTGHGLKDPDSALKLSVHP